MNWTASPTALHGWGQYLLLVLVSALVLGVVIGLILAIRLERPIISVTTAVSEIASGQRHAAHPRNRHQRDERTGTFSQPIGSAAAPNLKIRAAAS